MLQQNDALKQQTFEITGPAILRIKNAKTGTASLKTVLEKFAKVQGDLPDSTTVNKYAKQRYIGYIMNRASEAELQLKPNSKLVSGLADRLSTVSKRAITKSEITELAKKEKIDPTSE